MTKEEVYLLIGRLKKFEKELQICFEWQTCPTSLNWDDLANYKDCAASLYAYIRATNDEEIIIDCCKIQRHLFHRYSGSDNIGAIIGETGLFLYQIHNYALQALWGISQKDVEECKYYINSDGLCQNSETGELIPRPNSKPTNTAEGLRLPDELNTAEAKKYFARAVEAQFMELTPTGAKWLFGGNRGKARLAYFLERVYCPKPTDILQASQYRLLEHYFNANRLDRASQQNADTGKSQAVKQWRAEIEKLFTD